MNIPMLVKSNRGRTSANPRFTSAVCLRGNPLPSELNVQYPERTSRWPSKKEYSLYPILRVLPILSFVAMMLVVRHGRAQPDSFEQYLLFQCMEQRSDTAIHYYYDRSRGIHRFLGKWEMMLSRIEYRDGNGQLDLIDHGEGELKVRFQYDEENRLIWTMTSQKKGGALSVDYWYSNGDSGTALPIEGGLGPIERNWIYQGDTLLFLTYSNWPDSKLIVDFRKANHTEVKRNGDYLSYICKYFYQDSRWEQYSYNVSMRDSLLSKIWEFDQQGQLVKYTDYFKKHFPLDPFELKNLETNSGFIYDYSEEYTIKYIFKSWKRRSAAIVYFKEVPEEITDEKGLIGYAKSLLKPRTRLFGIELKAEDSQLLE
jgi:hypothetical protein